MSGSRVYLRGVDLVSLVDRYLKGEFSTLVNPLPVEASSLNQKTQSIVTVKENVNDINYQVDMGTGQTFGCLGYKVTDKNGTYDVVDPNKEYNCMYCLRKHKLEPFWGIPIRRDEKISPNGKSKIYFHMVDIFCSFKCRKAETKRRAHNTIYSHSMAYLAEIYNKSTGRDFDGLSASDQRFLKIFNGPMSWKEFHANTVTYSQVPGNMYFLPVIELMEQNSS
jgi:hypothetical protein